MTNGVPVCSSSKRAHQKLVALEILEAMRKAAANNRFGDIVSTLNHTSGNSFDIDYIFNHTNHALKQFDHGAFPIGETIATLAH